MSEKVGPIGHFIALDLETTGLSAAADRIVEIAAVRFLATGEEIGRYQTLVNPQRCVPIEAYAVHGISDEVLALASPAGDVLPSFLTFLGDSGATALIAHNAAFDAGFLGTEFKRAGLPIPDHSVFDSLALARSALPNLGSHRLEAVAEHLGLDPAGAHRAMADTLLVKQIWLRLGGPNGFASVTSFKMFDARETMALPVGWAVLEQVVARGSVLRIEYEGGTRGTALRSITPRRLESKGGSIFLVALCHLDSLEKSFRVDRIRTLEFTSETGLELVRVERPAAGG
jgi:DNA polymerase III epsilon subunit family exonuclease